MPTFPGAVLPDRERTFESCGLKLRVCEWGDPDAPPLLLAHGFFDHALAFALLAPILAAHYRVIAWDSRGHGDSERADHYSWPMDVIDTVLLLRDVGPAFLVGHSRGGGVVTDAAGLYPEGVRKLALLDGFGPPTGDIEVLGSRKWPEMPIGEMLRMTLQRRATTDDEAGFRPRASIDELAENRQLQNPRLSVEWMRFFAWHGARPVEGGFAWKVDPLASSGFGPFDPTWIDHGMRRLEMPVLAVCPGEVDVWTLPPAFRDERLKNIPDLEQITIADAGHFMAIEQPEEVARGLIDFFAVSS